MRIVTLNVNGLRAFDLKNNGDFNKFCLETLKADIVCLQEIKGSHSSLIKYHTLKDYQTFSSFYIKGRHGVSTLVKKSLFCEKSEEIVPGRVLKTTHGNFTLFNCYMPFYEEEKKGDKSEVLQIYQQVKENLSKSRTVICGDMNAVYNMLDHYQFAGELETLVDVDKWISHTQIYEKGLKKNENEKIREKKAIWKSIEETAREFADDSLLQDRIEKINPKKTELPYHFFTLKSLERYFFEVEQRKWLKKLVEEYRDAFRIHNRELSQYTCWNVLFNLRPKNLGTRIDHIFCSGDIECISSGIHPEILGSDHCPVFADFEIEIYEDEKRNLAKRKNNLLSFFK